MELRSSFTHDLRRELSNAYFLAKFGFDTAENEPPKVCIIQSFLARQPGRRRAAPGRRASVPAAEPGRLPRRDAVRDASLTKLAIMIIQHNFIKFVKFDMVLSNI